MDEDRSGFTKLIISVIALLIVLGIAYRLLKDDRVFNILFPEKVFGSEARQVIGNIRDGVTSMIDPVVAPIVDQGQILLQKVIDTVTGGVNKAVDQAKEKSINSAKEVINKNLAIIENKFGMTPDEKIPPTAIVEGRVLYPPVISVNTPEAIQVIQAAQMNQAIAAQLGLPAALQTTQGANGVLLMKDEAASKQRGNPVFTVFWEQQKKTFQEIATAIAATFENIFGYNAEYRMKIPITKNGDTKNYTIYIVVEE